MRLRLRGLLAALAGRRAAAADPSLDADLAQWWSTTTDRPRLRVLGSLQLTLGSTGQPGKAGARQAYCTEMVAYLASRPDGATTQEVAGAFEVSVTRVRRDVAQVRAWMGMNPATGSPFVPSAHDGRYRVEGLLSDADLFRRLRRRAERRGGPRGLDDLHQALKLVSGPLYAGIRPAGGAWLDESGLDEQLRIEILEVENAASMERGR